MLESRLNPKIREIEFGKRELQTLRMYPLSMADQFKVADIIGNVLQSLDGLGNIQDEMSVFISFVKEIENNLTKIVSLVADVGMEDAQLVTTKMTNDQFLEFAEIVWSVNFENALKNGKSLIEKIRQQWRPIQTEPIPNELSMRSLQQYSKDIVNSDSIISLDSVIDKEDSPSIKSESSTTTINSEEITN